MKKCIKNLHQYNWWMLLMLPAWVFVCFFASQIIITFLIWVLSLVNISYDSINENLFNTLYAAVVYLLTLFFVIIVPLLIKKSKINKDDIGLSRLPNWTDILITPAGLIIYLIFSSLLILLATRVIPWFDANQVQNTGFSQFSQRYEYVLAFLTLVVIAPIAEEILFRGYLYGKLKKYVPIWVAILATSILFGAIHGAWNLILDTFALSIILCLLRDYTGSIWASILLHMLKNGIAFYILFIYPSLLVAIVK
ncbi:MAG: type II CAAX endopeptidase family protein [Candidatus Saccharibacteria bacterium]